MGVKHLGSIYQGIRKAIEEWYLGDVVLVDRDQFLESLDLVLCLSLLCHHFLADIAFFLESGRGGGEGEEGEGEGEEGNGVSLHTTTHIYICT